MTSITLDTHIRAELADMLHRAFEPYAAKIAAPYADASHRTVERWLQGRATPSATAMLRMARNEAFRNELRAWCDRCERQETYISDALRRLDAPMAPVARREMEGAVLVGAAPRGSVPTEDGAPARRPFLIRGP